ncbi:CDC50-domain-containing protein [Rhizopus microsporus var. microsporus]|uniref:CDC50-domain-containing protein n=1 Tax=Rhizopus microsporus var. microsporus TaxID=86635 RepID=A0A1X0RGX8_RHIZD|nr:CDC50-domain-containing protein [Rhizopus microsporus var. microsporus]
MLIAFLSLLQVDEIMINYSYCRQYPNPVYLVPELYEYQLSDKTVNLTEMEPPAYHYSNESTFLNPNWGNPNQLTVPRCTLDFTVPTTMKGPVYMYYRLTNFYQNHRQYIKNFDSSQLLGEVVSSTTLHTDCDPLAYSNGKVIYPCGLIANSMFNDTVSNFTSIDHPSLIYSFSSNNIAWPSDKKKYGPTKYPLSDIVPPPNWANRYPNGQYTAEYPPPNLSQDEHFMVWMHVAALPDFRKIWGRNDSSDLPAGRWRVTIDMSKCA